MFNSIPHHFPIDLGTFGFVEREKDANGFKVKNRCGRDFLYYALAYHDPSTFSPSGLNPTEIERHGIFGLRLPASLIWTSLSFKDVPRVFKTKGLALLINSLPIRSYWSFMRAMLFGKPEPFERAIESIRRAIDAGTVVGIDVAIGMGGLIDHVMFVYGYDDQNLYVFDTHQSSRLTYEKMTPADDKRHIMRLPLHAIKERWTRWGRVWVVQKI